jgi:hypothetical protein
VIDAVETPPVTGFATKLMVLGEIVPAVRHRDPVLPKFQTHGSPKIGGEIIELVIGFERQGKRQPHGLNRNGIRDQIERVGVRGDNEPRDGPRLNRQ